MAKQAEGPIRVKGKLGNTVYTRPGKYGSTIRKVVEAGTKKEEKALKEQYSRTGYLNHLASDINTLISANSELLKSGRFYAEVQSRLRKEPLNNRLLLLRTLRGLDVHPGYPFGRQGRTLIAAKPEKKGLRVCLQVDIKPPEMNLPVDSYSYEVVVATWTKKKEPGDCDRQLSEWVMLSDGRPEFEFFFPKPPGAIHWMVAVRIRLGKDGIPFGNNKADGMMIADTGSFDAREQQWLQARENEPVEKKKIRTGKPAPDGNVERVKPKRIG